MVAAYAVALQVLLTGIVVSQHAGAATSTLTDSFGIICDASGSAAGEQGHTPDRGHVHPCTMCPLGMASVAVLSPTIGNLVDYPDTEAVLYRPAARNVALAPHPTPRLSQGPPHGV
jgi:hypothetical protein